MINLKYSIVATTYNDEKTILKYLQNILEQSYPPDEIVIADGGSKDNTVKLIESFLTKAPVNIRVLSGKRLNIAQGYNEAIKASQNKYIGITGVGNQYEKDYFMNLCMEIENKNIDLAYSPIRGINANGFSKKYNEAILNGEEGLILTIASNHGALVKKSVFEEQNYFYEKFVYAGEDEEFYSLVRDKGYQSSCVKEAKVYWETPISFSEFIKQIKNYTIASMQIKDNSRLIRIYWKKSTKLFLLFVSIIMLLFTFKSIYYSIPFLVLLVYNFLKSIKRKHYWLIIVRDYLPIYYIARNNKYLDSTNKVKR